MNKRAIFGISIMVIIGLLIKLFWLTITIVLLALLVRIVALTYRYAMARSDLWQRWK